MLDAWYIQFGFAGFAFALLGVLFWLIRQLLVLLRANQKVIERNTDVIASYRGDHGVIIELLREVRAKLGGGSDG